MATNKETESFLKSIKEKIDSQSKIEIPKEPIEKPKTNEKGLYKKDDKKPCGKIIGLI